MSRNEATEVRLNGLIRVQTFVEGVSRTKQSPTDDTDVNAIMRKYLSSGLISHYSRQEPRYGDFTMGVDYHTALNSVREAQERFMELPAHVRQHVGNDPGALLDLVFDPARAEEARALGLLVGDDKPPVAPGGAIAPPVEPSTTPAGDKPA